MQMQYEHPQLIAARKTNAMYKNTIANIVGALRLTTLVVIVTVCIFHKNTTKTSVKQSQSIVNR